jgi:hypothetical protein
MPGCKNFEIWDSRQKMKHRKLGGRYATILAIATFLAIAVVYRIEELRQQWVLDHPILDGAIGGAIIVPISGILALLIIDRRIEAVAQRERRGQVSRQGYRLRISIRRSLTGGILGGIGLPDEGGKFDVADLRTFLKVVATWDRRPTDLALERVEAVVIPHLRRCAEIAEQLASLMDKDRLQEFSDFISDGADWIELAAQRERRVRTSIVKHPFYSVYAPVLESVVNLANEFCPDALPLALTPDSASPNTMTSLPFADGALFDLGDVGRGETCGPRVLPWHEAVPIIRSCRDPVVPPARTAQ